MRRWVVTIFILVIVIALVLGGITTFVQFLFPEGQQVGFAAFVIGTTITGGIASLIVTIMGWFGISPLDWLPERTLEETLRKRDPARFRLARSVDPTLLAEQTKSAKNMGQSDWVVVFAKAWLKLRPHEQRGYELLGDAFVKLDRYDEALEIGTRLTKLAPLEHSGFELQGHAHKAKGQLPEARESYERALKLARPEYKEYVLSNLTEIYEKLGLLDEAIKSLETLLDSLGNDPADSFSKDYHSKNLEHLKSVRDNQARPKN